MIKKILITFIFIIILNFSYSFAETIKNFKVSGNDRISDETIILFSGFNVNDSLDENSLNDIIKRLYETSFFKDISIEFNENILVIKVEENPLIQSVGFTGIKKQSLVEQIKEFFLTRTLS